MCEGKDHITLPFLVDEDLIEKTVGDKEFK